MGSGQIGKLLNNFVFTAQLTVGLEAFDFAHRLGVDRAALADVLAKGSGTSFGIGLVARSGLGTAGMRPLAETILAKDVGLMLDVADRAGVAEPAHVAELARAFLRMCTED